MLYAIFVEHAPVDPVRMTYSNGYQNARTGVGSKVLVFTRPCGYGGRSRCHPNFNDATSISKRSKYTKA